MEQKEPQEQFIFYKVYVSEEPLGVFASGAKCLQTLLTPEERKLVAEFGGKIAKIIGPAVGKDLNKKIEEDSLNREIFK